MEQINFSVYVKKLQKFLDNYDRNKNDKKEDKNNSINHFDYCNITLLPPSTYSPSSTFE